MLGGRVAPQETENAVVAVVEQVKPHARVRVAPLAALSGGRPSGARRTSPNLKEVREQSG